MCENPFLTVELLIVLVDIFLLCTSMYFYEKQREDLLLIVINFGTIIFGNLITMLTYYIC